MQATRNACAICRPRPLPLLLPAPLPALAQEIFGKTYVFPPNVREIESTRLEFDGGDTATLTIALTGQELQTWPMGLDGVYRMSPGELGLPLGVRGHWEDDGTFLLEYNSIGNNDYVFLRMKFAGDSVTIDSWRRRTRSAWASKATCGNRVAQLRRSRCMKVDNLFRQPCAGHAALDD